MKSATGSLKSLAQYLERAGTTIALKSGSAGFHRRQGERRTQQGNLSHALMHFKIAVCLEPDSTDACIALSEILRQTHPVAYDPKLARALEACFASPAVEYPTLAAAAGRQVRSKHGLTRESSKAWEEVLSRDGVGPKDETILGVLGDPLLAVLLVKTTNVDPELELFLTGVRCAEEPRAHAPSKQRIQNMSGIPGRIVHGNTRQT